MASPSFRLVLFAHGSRDPRWREPFQRLADEVAERVGSGSVRLAFMEFEPPSLQRAVEEAIADGVGHIRVLPLFTAPGKHVREDVPRIVARARRTAPHARIDLLPPVGDDPRFADLLRAIALDAVPPEALGEPPEGPSPGTAAQVP